MVPWAPITLKEVAEASLAGLDALGGRTSCPRPFSLVAPDDQTHPLFLISLPRGKFSNSSILSSLSGYYLFLMLSNFNKTDYIASIK